MNIVLLEDDFFTQKLTKEDLKKAFPKANIISFDCITSFLEATALPSTYVLVTEHFLTLMMVDKHDEKADKRYSNLIKLYPWVDDDFDRRDGGERIAKHVLANNPRVKILFYTHSSREEIAPNLLSNQRVSYLPKGWSDREHISLKNAINSF